MSGAGAPARDEGVAAEASPPAMELASARGDRESLVRAIDPPPPPAAEPGRTVRAYVEAVVLTAAFPVVGWLVDREDPFWLRHPFPWIVFAPLLIGLRHGFAAGCTSALTLGGALVLSWRERALGVADFPAEPALGLFALAMLTGQFSDVWRRDVRRLDARLASAQRRSGELARAHFLLELSHERLREESGGAPNLRDALSLVSQLAVSADGSWAPIAERMMSIFAAYAMLEVGVVVRVDGQGRAAGTIATLGREQLVDPDDPMLIEAARSRELTYLPTATAAGRAGPGGDAAGIYDPPPSRLLAAVPFVDTGGGLHAVLCVQSMPFAAFHKKTLEALAVLAGHFADLMATRGECVGTDGARRLDFEVRLARALHDRKRFGVPAVVVGLWMRQGSEVATIREVVVAGLLRAIDAPLRARDRGGNWILMFLAPTADGGYARAIQARFEAIVRRELDASPAEAGATFGFHSVGPDDTVARVIQRIANQVQPS